MTARRVAREEEKEGKREGNAVEEASNTYEEAGDTQTERKNCWRSEHTCALLPPLLLSLSRVL